ncbi:ATP-dependent DNA helicase RecG [Ectothiorhodospiraceae bacterium BW-2]|nr:ATP-dependent DNA helicase RecG [Ectothiorhodospiraceae bacterium BW-2]
MEIIELLQIISQGEDSRNQFKKNLNNPDSLVQELIAFSNSLGGRLFIGVDESADKKGDIIGLSSEDIHRINQLLSNVASQHIKPAINPLTEIVTIDGKRILIIDVAKGMNKPYQDKNGTIWVKSGSDKRKATSREELQRLFQSASLVHADEVVVQNSTINDIDLELFDKFFEKEFEEKLAAQELPVTQILENMNLARKGEFNLACFLLFGKNNKFKLPTCLVKCVCYPGDCIDEENYIESQDNTGTILDIYKETTIFLARNIKSIQGDQGVNSIGVKEIPNIVFEELVTNALIHRDYFVSAPIRIFIFSDRIEIISPGHLPNNLTVENIKAGNSNIRNPILTSFATKLLPYRGLGNGIRRALKAYPDIDFIDDREGNLFKCIIKRVAL